MPGDIQGTDWSLRQKFREPLDCAECPSFKHPSTVGTLLSYHILDYIYMFWVIALQW